EVSASLIALIRAIGEHWYSAKELREMMGFKSKSSFIKNYLNPAQNFGIIQFEDMKNPQSPNQRYGLTEKGKQILNQKKL
ncbi:MAG: ATP-dependent DNA helicase RecG, partial [Muribaculaceae bacterium]|nr:ATP-dependent DNA helicase RecG [Muribaculaceae bacterium]